MSRRALDIVADYINLAWNRGRAEMVRELCTDPIIRHDPNSRVALSHDEQEARIRYAYDDLRTTFENVVFYGDDNHVTLVWNVTGRDPAWKLCGIEIFRVANGRITEVWNLPYADGRWSMSRGLAGRIGDGPAMTFPILDIEVSDIGAKVTVPLDARNIARWFELSIGPAETTPHGAELWRHRFGRGPATDASLIMTDTDGPDRAIVDANVKCLTIGLVPSAVVNASIEIAGRSSPLAASYETADEAPAVVRLAQVFGTFTPEGGVGSRVVDARIVLTSGQRGATGAVTLRVAEGTDTERGLGSGHLSFGWRQGDFAVSFDADVRLGSGVKLRQADGGIDVSVPWQANDLEICLINDKASMQ